MVSHTASSASSTTGAATGSIFPCAGEKLFLDYCGRGLPILDAAIEENRDAQVFVAVMGTSNFTFAETAWSQVRPD